MSKSTMTKRYQANLTVIREERLNAFQMKQFGLRLHQRKRGVKKRQEPHTFRFSLKSFKGPRGKREFYLSKRKDPVGFNKVNISALFNKMSNKSNGHDIVGYDEFINPMKQL